MIVPAERLFTHAPNSNLYPACSKISLRIQMTQSDSFIFVLHKIKRDFMQFLSLNGVFRMY